MLEDLFIPDEPSGSISSEIELSEDLNSWPMEIQNAIMAAIPGIADVPGQLFMDEFDRDKMYAKGSYVISTPEDDIIIPIVIKAKKLLPLDLFIYKGQWHLMDPNDIIAILTPAQPGSELIAPKDIPPTAYSSMINRTMPPGGYGSGILSSVATKISALRKDVSEKILNEIRGNPQLIKKIANSALLQKSIEKLTEAEPATKTASMENPFMGKDAVITALGMGQFSVNYTEDGIVVKAAQIDGDQLATFMKEAGLNCRQILEDLTKNRMALSWDDTVGSLEVKSATVKTAGVYTVYPSNKSIKSYVLGGVKTAAGGDKILACNDNGTYTMQSSILGTKVSELTKTALTAATPKLASDMRVGDTVAVPLRELSYAKGSMPELLTPVKIASVVHQGNVSVISGDSEEGKVAFLVTKDKFNRVVRAEHTPEGVAVPKLATAWYVPSDLLVFTLPNTKTAVARDELDLQSAFMLDKAIPEKLGGCAKGKLWKTGVNTYALKIGAAAPELLSDVEALLLVKKADGGQALQTMKKMASGHVKTLDMIVGRKDEKEEKKSSFAPVSIASTLKVAAVMEDEETVDTVLSLNYITPENMQELKAALPEMQKTEEVLCRILMSIRLGNPLLDEQDVKHTIEALHSIIRELSSAM